MPFFMGAHVYDTSNTNDTVERDDANIFDYIICGGGTSGCALASRLAEDESLKILLIESGPREIDSAKVPAGGISLVRTERDWNIESVPQVGLDGRIVNHSSGHFLGGSSGLNGTLCVRGVKQDFDNWKLPGWSGDEVFKYMAKAERFHSAMWFKHDAESHGTQGLIHTEPYEPAPISSLLLDSLKSAGFPFKPDMFSTGDTVYGCGHAIRTTQNGERSLATDYIKAREDGWRSKVKKIAHIHGMGNLRIASETRVDRVLFTEDSQGKGLRATGVVTRIHDTYEHVVSARKEVILTAGAYNTPAILQRSGVGPPDLLQQHHIDVKIPLCGVGQNLQDHPLAFLFYAVNDPGLTKDAQIHHHPDALAHAQAEWATHRTGFLSSFPFGVFAYTRLDDRLQRDPLWQAYTQRYAPSDRDAMNATPAQPHLELFNTECYVGPPTMPDAPRDGASVFAVMPMLLTPHSRGTVRLRDADPFSLPAVDHRYLTDPLDARVLAEGCRLAHEIVTTAPATKHLIKDVYPADAAHASCTTPHEWEKYVRATATTCYHPVGTCRMGDVSSASATSPEHGDLVVSSTTLKVHGTCNLRVADVSIVPTISSGHTMMVAYAVAEKAADMIKEELRRAEKEEEGGN